MRHLAAQAALRPGKVALRACNGGGGAEAFDELTYAQLQARVLGLSATLRALAGPGERALILMPSGAEFIIAFLACLHAGIIAVPACTGDLAGDASTSRIIWREFSWFADACEWRVAQ